MLHFFRNPFLLSLLVDMKLNVSMNKKNIFFFNVQCSQIKRIMIEIKSILQVCLSAYIENFSICFQGPTQPNLMMRQW